MREDDVRERQVSLDGVKSAKRKTFAIFAVVIANHDSDNILRKF